MNVRIDQWMMSAPTSGLSRHRRRPAHSRRVTTRNPVNGRTAE